MAKKTKADLERLLQNLERLLQIEEQQTRFLAKHNQEIAEDLKERNQELNALEEKYKELLNRFSALADKHDVFVENYRTEKKEIADQRAKLEAKATAQEGRIMVCETAMRSMAIHIAILEQQKGKA